MKFMPSNLTICIHVILSLFKAMPWGQVPVLEVNGEKLSQSTTIYRYVAKKLGLQGDTEMEIAKCDEYINVIVTDARQGSTI